MSEPPKTVKGVLEAATAYLGGKGLESPRLTAELLASRLLNCRRLELYLRFDHVLSDKQLDAMRRGVTRVAQGEPIQYVLGQTEFMGHVFKVDRRALIPRPETELLVETVTACEPLWAMPHPAIVDIGTGSGCIVISLALARPQGLYVALDVSPDALALARENAAALGAADRIGFSADSLADAVEPETISAIVANLPYVATAAYEQLPVHIRAHEPRQALDGGADGLDVIRDVAQDAAMALQPGGFLFLEIGFDQGDAVRQLLAGAGFASPEVKQDLAGKDRIAVARLPA